MLPMAVASRRHSEQALRCNSTAVGGSSDNLKRKLQRGCREQIRCELHKLVCQDSAYNSKTELRTLGRRLRANDEAIHNLTKAVEMGFDAAVAMQRLQALKSERVELENLKDKLTRKVADTVDPDAIVEGALGLLDEFEDVMASAPLPKQKAILRCFVAGARANPKERRVEVAFYQVPFQRDTDSCVPYVAMPEVRVEPTRRGYGPSRHQRNWSNTDGTPSQKERFNY